MILLRYKTSYWIPPIAEITLRTERNDWKDLRGRYELGGWTFELPAETFAGKWEAKLVLDGAIWMNDPNLTFTVADGETHDILTDAVVFNDQRRGPVREYGQLQRRYFEPPIAPTDQPYDVIVIGSGIGGGILADEVSDLGFRVLVLEAGGLLFPTHVANLPRRHRLDRDRIIKHIWELWGDFQSKQYEKLANNDYDGAYGFNLGGRSLFWGAFIPRMTSWELDFWGQDVKWALEDVYYQRAEDVLGRSTQPRTLYVRRIFQFLRTTLPELNHMDAPISARQNPVDSNTVASGVFSTADLLMESSLTGGREGRLQVNLNHMVEGVSETVGGVAVQARDLKTQEVRIYEAKYAVLAAGTLESARLALRSGLQPNALIGKGLTDHPVYFAHFKISRGSEFYDPFTSAKTLSQPREREGQERPPYNILLEINADLNQGRYLDDNILNELIESRGEWVLGEIVFLLNAELQEDNFLQIATGDQHAQISALRVPVSQQLEDQLKALANQLVVDGLGGEIIKQDFGSVGGVAHEVGTLRMQRTKGKYVDQHGPQPGVLDENLRFLDHQRLYACDLAVFPTSPAANPTLTLAALAIRLADHLRTRLTT
jgi:choline dehydrogenase-like flavoprotein